MHRILSACIVMLLSVQSTAIAEANPVDQSMSQYEFNEWTVNYIEKKPYAADGILFIHGAPGSFKSFYRYFERPELTQNLISVDRPGYGETVPAEPLASVSGQAAVLKPLIELFDPDGINIIVGHSFGGPIAMEIAAENTDIIDGVILLAPTLFGDLEKIFWFNKPAEWPWVKPFVPRGLQVANDEKFAHITGLDALNKKMTVYPAHVTLIHGKRDRLVRWENSTRAASMLSDAEVRLILLEREDHFIPWSKEDLVVEEILRMFAKIR